MGRLKTTIPSTMPFIINTQVVEKGRKVSLHSVLSQAAAMSEIQAEKTLRSCTTAYYPWAAPSLHHSFTLGSETAAGCDLPSSMPWFIPVSSRCCPPYNTGVSECATGKNPFRDSLCAHTSVTPGPMELRTKLQAWHTPCRKKGSGGIQCVPAALDKMG